MIPWREKCPTTLEGMLPACLVLFTTICIAGCGSIHVALKPEGGFSREKTIQIVAEHGDPAGLKGKLEGEFRQKGFTVVSTADVPPEYELRFRYFYDPVAGDILSFSAEIVRVRTKEVVGVAASDGVSTAGAIADGVATKIAEKVAMGTSN